MMVQLPEIMQQQQAKIGAIKKQHNERFNGSNKKYQQLGVNAQMGATMRDTNLNSLAM